MSSSVSDLAVEWTTSMDVRRLVADPLSENMAAFCYQSGSTDRKLQTVHVKTAQKASENSNLIGS